MLPKRSKKSGELKSSLKEPKSTPLSSNHDKKIHIVDVDAPQPSAGELSGKVEEQPEPEKQSDLAQIVAESKERLAEEPQVAPRKRGRPKGSKSAAATAPSETEAQAKEAAQQLISPTYLSTGIQVLGKRAAINSGYSGFEVPKDEADHLSVLADACMQRYFPNLSDTHALLAVTIFSFGMAIGGRYMGYQDFLASQGKHASQKPVKEVQETNSESAKQAPIGADEFLR